MSLYDTVAQGLTKPVMVSATTNADYTATKVAWILPGASGWTGRARFAGTDLWQSSDFTSSTTETWFSGAQIPGLFDRVVTTTGTARLVLPENNI